MSNQNAVFKKILLILPVFLVTLILSWDNNKTQTLQTQGLRSNLPDNQYVDIKNFPVLCIPKSTLEDLLEGRPRVHKLVFEFNINESETYNPSLTVYRAKKKKRRFLTDKPNITLERKTKTELIEGEFFLANLELERKYYQDSLKTKPGYGSATGLFFYPKKNELKQVYYQLRWGKCDDDPDKYRPLDVDGSLNPSPPADPK